MALITRILGVDPGTKVLGYSILDVFPHNKIEVVCAGSIFLDTLQDSFQKLGHIANRLTSIVEEYAPNQLAIESPFVGKNVQSAIKIGRAQGVVIALAAQKGLQIHEYAPKQIKQAVTGNGNASKEQVYDMIKLLLKIELNPTVLDTTDALAIAYTHAQNATANIQSVSTKTSSASNKKAKSWSNFAATHPDRIAKSK